MLKDHQRNYPVRGTREKSVSEETEIVYEEK